MLCGWRSICPVAMAAKTSDDLLLRGNWTFSNEFIYCKEVKAPYGIGAPFFTPGYTDPDNPMDKREMDHVGSLEALFRAFVWDKTLTKQSPAPEKVRVIF